MATLSGAGCSPPHTRTSRSAFPAQLCCQHGEYARPRAPPHRSHCPERDQGSLTPQTAPSTPASRLLLKGPGVLFGALASPARPKSENFSFGQNEIYQRGRKLEAGFRYTNLFFLASAPPPMGRGVFSISNSLPASTPPTSCQRLLPRTLHTGPRPTLRRRLCPATSRTPMPTPPSMDSCQRGSKDEGEPALREEHRPACPLHPTAPNDHRPRDMGVGGGAIIGTQSLGPVPLPSVWGLV